MSTDWVHVQVPATSANLGPGFDALGLALDLVDDVGARLTDDGIDVSVEGEGADTVARDESHLVVRSLLATAQRLGVALPGVAVRSVNRIPHGRGLGSSAAAICAGVLLADALAGSVLTAAQTLAVAAELEGHADNVAPCLLGGLTVAWQDADCPAAACRLEPDESIRPVLFVPPFTALTSTARAALPEVVPHRDAAVNAGRAALLVAGLTHDPAVLVAATEDRLHQRYRAAGQPQTAALLDALRTAGLPAVVSGAGPSVLVLSRSADEAAAAHLHAPRGWAVLEPGVRRTGALDDRPRG